METVSERTKLIEAARQGDSAAIDRLMIECQTDVRRYARRACVSQDVDDAVQDALIILHRRVGTLRHFSAFSGWLFQIVKNACLRMTKQRAARDALRPHVQAVAIEADLALRLDLAMSIQSLPPLYRDVVLLRDVGGFSAEEAAHRVGVSVEAVKSRLHRARQLLRQKFTSP